MAQLMGPSTLGRTFVEGLTDDDVAFLERVRSFSHGYVRDNAHAWDQAESFPKDIFKTLAQQDLLRLTIPKEMGGLDISTKTYVEIVRTLSQGCGTVGMTVAAHNALGTSHIVRFGSDEQRTKYLPKISSGEMELAWALTEPEAGSDARGVATRGVPVDGKPGWFELSGEKMFITNAGRADVIVVVGRIDDEDLTGFLVETNQPGFEVVERIRTAGVRASNTAQVRFDKVMAWHTPCKFAEAIGFLQRGRLGIASMAIGIAERALELAVDWSKRREQFGRPLAKMQSIQNMIADSATDVEAGKALIRTAAAAHDRGEDILTSSSMAKLFCGEASNRVTNRAVQILGGRGMVPEYEVEKCWRDAKLTEIGEGSSEIQRFVIARNVISGS